MNKFKNLFSKKSKKEEIEWQSITENKHKNKKTADSAACYHSQTAPKTHRGPKSWAGRINDEIYEDYSNSSAAAIQNRRREPQFASTRQNRTYSEYDGGDSRVRDVRYKEEFHFSDEEEIDVKDLVKQLRDAKQKLYFLAKRKNYYKSEWRDAMKTQDSMQKAFKTREEDLEMKLIEKENTIQMMKQLQYQCKCKNHVVSNPVFPQNGVRQSFTFFDSSATSSVISDPRQTARTSMPYSSFLDGGFGTEDLSISSSTGNGIEFDISD